MRRDRTTPHDERVRSPHPPKNNSQRRQKNRYYATNAKRNRRDTCLAATGDSPQKNKNGSGYAGTTIYTGTSRGLSYSAHAPALGGRGGHLIDRRTPTRTRSRGQHEKDTKRQKRSLVDDSEHRTTPLAGSHRSRPLSSADDHYTWHSSSWFGGEPRNKKVQIKCRRFAFKSGSVLCERRAAEGDVVTARTFCMQPDKMQSWEDMRSTIPLTRVPSVCVVQMNVQGMMFQQICLACTCFQNGFKCKYGDGLFNF